MNNIKLAKELVKVARKLCSDIKPPNSKVNITMQLRRKGREYDQVQEANIVFGTNATIVIETFSGNTLQFSSSNDVSKVLKQNIELIPPTPFFVEKIFG